MVEEIVIIGAGGQGKEVAFFINRLNDKSNEFNVLGFLDDNENLHNLEINGFKVLGGLDWFDDNNHSNLHCILALGEPVVKKKVETKLEKFGLKYANIIDPSAIIDNKTVNLGKGLIIAPGVVILPNVQIEDHVLINYNSVVGHDCKIGKYATLGPNVGLAGNVTINEGSYIGLGANVIQNL